MKQESVRLFLLSFRSVFLFGDMTTKNMLQQEQNYEEQLQLEATKACQNEPCAQSVRVMKTIVRARNPVMGSVTIRYSSGINMLTRQ